MIFKERLRTKISLNLFRIFFLFLLPLNFLNAETLTNEQRTNNSQVSTDYINNNFGDYVLGAGDVIFIEILNIDELSGSFEIGPSGSFYLPRLRKVYAEGYTIEEFRNLITLKYKEYLINPEIYIRPVSFRPVRVYVGGEVSRPGYYNLSGIINSNGNLDDAPIKMDVQSIDNFNTGTLLKSINTSGPLNLNNRSSAPISFPTLYDAIKKSNGVTAYSDLSKVSVVRKISKGQGGGKKKANLNFLTLLTEGDESQNIRLFDDDVIYVSKSDIVLKDQLINASQTNLSPDFITVFVSGRVNNAGRLTLPQGASLNQALIGAAGPKILRGQVEFVRFSRGGDSERRQFNYSPEKPSGSYENPILASGDLVLVRDNLLSATSTVMGEIVAPFIGFNSIYNFFNGVF